MLNSTVKSCLQKWSLALFAASTVCLLFPLNGAAFQGAPSPAKSQVYALQMHADLLSKNIAVVRNKLNELTTLSFQHHGQLDQKNVSRASFEEVIGTLQTQRVNLMIEMAGLDAKLKAAKSMTKKDAKMTDEQLKYSKLLKEVVTRLSDEAERASKLAQSGSISRQEYQRINHSKLQAEIALAEAEAEMNLKNSPGHDGLDQLMVEVSLQQAESMARLEMVNRLLEEYIEVRPVLSQIKKHDDQIARLKRQLETDESELARIQNDMKLRLLSQEQAEFENDRKNSDDR